MIKFQCIFCNSPKIKKNGKNRNRVQRFYCFNCSRNFLESYTNKAFSRLNIASDIQKLSEKGLSKRKIAKALEISPMTVQKFAPLSKSRIKSKLTLGDCEKLIKAIPSESIDLVLTDPPYNIAKDNKLTKVGDKIITNKQAWGNEFKDNWNNVNEYLEIFLFPKIKECKRILKKTGSLIMFLDRKYTGYFIYQIEKEFDFVFKNKIYFEKVNPLPAIRKINYRSTMEEAIWFSNKNEKYTFNFLNQFEMKQIFRGSIGGNKKTKHPTEKYSWMIDPLILRHSNRFDTVLDLFSGSGAISYSAIKYQREVIAFEIKEEYYQNSLCKK